jgi:hypothetical protein
MARSIRTARRARKSSAGYDLTRLLVGSEGTLGVITSKSRLGFRASRRRSPAACARSRVEAACNAVIMTIQMGIPVARVELLDALQMKACNAYSGLAYPESPTLFVEFHGTEAGTRRTGRAVRRDRSRAAAAASSTGPRRNRPHPSCGSPPRCLLGHQGSFMPGAKGISDRCLRADLAACRMRRGDPGKTSSNRIDRADPRSRRRWQFPCAAAHDTAVIRPRSSRCRGLRRAAQCAPWRWTAPAPANTASAQGKRPICRSRNG